MTKHHASGAPRVLSFMLETQDSMLHFSFVFTFFGRFYTMERVCYTFDALSAPDLTEILWVLLGSDLKRASRRSDISTLSGR